MAKLGEEFAESASKIAGITANKKLKIQRTVTEEDGTVVVSETRKPDMKCEKRKKHVKFRNFQI